MQEFIALQTKLTQEHKKVPLPAQSLRAVHTKLLCKKYKYLAYMLALNQYIIMRKFLRGSHS